jgi:hypothetical protein
VCSPGRRRRHRRSGQRGQQGSRGPWHGSLPARTHQFLRAAPGRCKFACSAFPQSPRWPLAGAIVEAAWDPESLGDKSAVVPKPIAITCDEGGRGHLDMAVPPGRGKLNLLVSARWQGHERTRTLEVERSQRHDLDLRVSDTDVVPGGKLSAWVVLRDRVTGKPAGKVAVDLALKEGAVARFSRRLVTDHAGMASAEVPIPFVEDPEWKWVLSARTAAGHGDEVEATVTLGVREETPQAPTLRAHWQVGTVPPGSKATFVVEVRDGTGRRNSQAAPAPLGGPTRPAGAQGRQGVACVLDGNPHRRRWPGQGDGGNAQDHLAPRLQSHPGGQDPGRGAPAGWPGHLGAGDAGAGTGNAARVRSAAAWTGAAPVSARHPRRQTHRRRIRADRARAGRARTDQPTRLGRSGVEPSARGWSDGARQGQHRLRGRSGRHRACALDRHGQRGGTFYRPLLARGSRCRRRSPA